MADPTTSNVLLAVPSRGSDVGTWDVPINGNSTSLDGYLGGVATVSVSNANVTLTAPTGTVTPTAGPYQSQNRILVFTGAMSANLKVTFPLPGEYIIQNQTTGNFVMTFAGAGAGNVVATPQGSIMKVWNDGTNAWLFKNEIPGELKFMGGISAVPAWVSACTIPPYLLADGSIHNYSTYGALGTLYGSNFGGNGITTFGVPDLRGRVPLAYDGTGTRITSAVCGINGQTLGAAGGEQGHTLITGEIPSHNHGVTDPQHEHSVTIPSGNVYAGGSGYAYSNQPSFTSYTTAPALTGISIQNTGGGGTHNNVQPAQVSGIWLVST